MIDDVHRQRQIFAQIVDAPVRIEGPRGAEFRLIHLHDQPGVGDGLVFLAAGVGYRLHILLFTGVVLVVDARPQAQRTKSRHVALNVFALNRSLQVRHIFGNCRLTNVLDRRRAGTRLAVGDLAYFARCSEAWPDRSAGAGIP